MQLAHDIRHLIDVLTVSLPLTGAIVIGMVILSLWLSERGHRS